MKTMRKIFAMALVLMLVMSLATTAFAAETKGTIVNNTDRTYKAYQIFSGTQAEGDAVLGDIAWGTGINADTFLTALKALKVENATPFENCKTANDVAGVLQNKADNSAIAKAFANLAAKHLTSTATDVAANKSATLPSGYYLLVDTSTGNAAQNPALLQVTNDAQMNITDKSGAPSVGKSVDDNDANIGDTVNFTLTATMPSTFEGYETYKVVFHDTMSAGLTYVENSIVVPAGFTSKVVKNTDGTTTITVTNDNVLDDNVAVNATLTVTYKATLNSNAVIGAEGNPNEVYLEYSNDPNTSATSTANTPEEEVEIFTWQIPVYKYTGANKTPLAGAGFTLYDGENAVKLTRVGETNVYKVDPNGKVTEIVTDETGRFEIEGLEKGPYVLKETTTPAGYNTCADVTVVIGENGALTQDGTDTTEVGILNNAGSTLPETGGIGTTLFYVFGAIMMVGAAILLVTKKRMASAE